MSPLCLTVTSQDSGRLDSWNLASLISRMDICEIDVLNQLFSRYCSALLSSNPQPRPLVSRQAWGINHRPYFDRPLTYHGNPCRDADGLVELLGLDKKVTAKLFVRLRERTICHEPFAVAQANSGRHICRIQWVGGQILPTLFDLVRELRGLYITRLPLSFAQGALVNINQQHVFHSSGPPMRTWQGGVIR